MLELVVQILRYPFSYYFHFDLIKQNFFVVQPMEVDLTTSFESVGGSESHIMCLREMVVLPLLYPEIFSKFKIAPPRGGN